METTRVRPTGLLVAALLFAGPVLRAAENMPETDPHAAVLAMKPVGYWPADEGKGEVVHDLSGNSNHGRIYHVPWKDGFLDFTGAFQWIEIPDHPAHRCETFSIGGWILSRAEDYTDYGHADGMIFIGDGAGPWSGRACALALFLRNECRIGVLRDAKPVAVGPPGDKAAIQPGRWEHLLLTGQGGTGKLYVNGQPVWTAKGIAGIRSKRGLLVGADASWWMLYPNGSRSLHGSVRHLVLFNRALTAAEITRLAEATRPQRRPATPAGFADFAKLSPDRQRALLDQLLRQKDGALRPQTADLLPLLKQALTPIPTRAPAAELLRRLHTDDAKAILQQAAPRWRRTLADEEATDEERAAALAALAGGLGRHPAAREAVPVMLRMLRERLDRHGAHLPRPEDLLRNRLILALREIDGSNPEVDALLGDALVKPVFAQIDVTQPHLNAVQSRLDKGNHLAALHTFVQTRSERPPADQHYYSQGDEHRNARGNIHQRAYCPAATRNGYTYILGTGKGFSAAEKIPPAQFTAAVERIAAKHPAARNWRKADFPNVFRLRITKTDPKGGKQSAFFGGEDFIFDGTDAKVQGWSVAVDDRGFLHISGGQHNRPNPGAFIPGSWEQFGLSRDGKSREFPEQLYFISKKPHDITSFECVGRRDSQSKIPAGYFNYMNFLQDNDGRLYTYGRVNAAGRQSWGLFRYDAEARRWATIGGQPCDVINDALKHDSRWGGYLHHMIRGGTPTKPGGQQALVWAWQPHFYNYCRSGFAIRFDRANRMHLFLDIRGLGEAGRIVDSQVYAWSDDGGKTFHRADGSEAKLPLTLNPAPTHYAGIDSWRHKSYYRPYSQLVRLIW